MADIRFAIAILWSGVAYPIRAVPDDPAHNALKRLGPVDGAATDAEDQEWFASSLDLLVDNTRDDPHFESEGTAGGAPPLVEANATPWYAVFEDDAGDLWVARFFGPNLPGRLTEEAAERLHGVHVVKQDPGEIDLATLDEDTRTRRSVIMLSRGDFGEETAGTRDHGGGGGSIKTEW